MNDPKRIIIVLLGLIVVGLMAMGIKDHMDSEGYKNQVNYTTAVQSTKPDDFNYIVDSQQGRVLTSGTFTVKDGVNFPEMTKKYTYVNRVKEHYTMHTRTVCTGSGKSESCHTEVYYTWDEIDEKDIKSPEINYMGRDYPTALFNIKKYNKGTNCSEFSPAGSGTGWFQEKKGCIDGDYYLNDDDRYVYYTVPTTFDATFLATTFGGLKPFNEKSITLQNKTIDQVLKDVGKYQLISFWVVTILLIFLTIGACFAAYAWVMEDGVWSVDR